MPVAPLIRVSPATVENKWPVGWGKWPHKGMNERRGAETNANPAVGQPLEARRMVTVRMVGVPGVPICYQERASAHTEECCDGQGGVLGTPAARKLWVFASDRVSASALWDKRYYYYY